MIGRLLPVLAVFLLLTGCALWGASAPEPPGDAGKILIRYRWTDRDEGKKTFHVYRSGSRSGPFERITGKPVPAGKAEPGELITVMTDYGVRLGETYYYYLSDLSAGSEGARSTPVVEAVAVLPLQPEDRSAYRAQMRESEAVEKKEKRPLRPSAPAREKAEARPGGTE